ncbi:unnamed protein product [Psylliodes chrysocephalus]|uniref:Phosphatidylcholine transfer protein n=1 Tax=Psylliodes chrysocephalus TaxID=3402493 RepID=A0A9P0CK70_9CUCU|nr:unnamed protein product [Psylliodes chrysocephala]
MFPRRLSEFWIPLNSNLKNVLLKVEYQKLFAQKYSFFRRNFNDFKDFEQLNKKFQGIIKRRHIFGLFLAKPFLPRKPKESVLKVWAYHCECVVAQRLRRCQQMFTLYSKWWEEKALKEFIRKMRQNLTRRGKEFAIASAAVYNWDKNRISLEDIKTYEKEFEYIDVLKDKTICLSCDPSQRTKTNTNICKCGTTGKPTDKTYENWMPFIEKTDLVVWRRLHASGSGQYEYKMFGTYNDVSAEDFLNVQIDIDYRRKWDTTAVVLKQGDTEENTNSDIIYWEMLWPRLFTNRDYVFCRRYLIDESKKTLYIMSKSTSHPSFPKYSDKFRIEDYWSCMVIRPYKEMNKPGLEFVLTYYDNPGINIPGTVTTWVATRAMPDFLDKLREATRNYKIYCRTEGKSKACQRTKKVKDKKDEGDTLDYCSIIREAKKLLIQHAKGDFKEDEQEQDPGNKDNDFDHSGDIGATQQNTSKRTSFFKYFHPLYYFQ